MIKRSHYDVYLIGEIGQFAAPWHQALIDRYAEWGEGAAVVIAKIILQYRTYFKYRSIMKKLDTFY